MKRKLSSISIILVISILLTACISTDKNTVSSETDASSDELKTLDVLSLRCSYIGKQPGWGAKVLEDKFNIELNYLDYSNFYNGYEMGGEDILILSENEFKDAIEKDALYDLEKDGLLDTYGGNIKSYTQKALDETRTLSSEGKCYGVPNNVKLEDKEMLTETLYTWDIRWDLYEKLGCPEVKNLDDMLDLLKNMREICPEDEYGNPTYAISMWSDWDKDLVMYVKCLAEAYYGYDGDLGIGHYNSDTGDFYGALEENSPYLSILKFVNRLYREGLIDENLDKQNFDYVTKKAEKGGVLFSIFDYSGHHLYNTDKHLSDGKMMGSLVPKDAHTAICAENERSYKYYWAIGKNAKNPELAMELINWLYTPEGELTVIYGPMYENDNGGLWYFDDEKRACLTEGGKAARNGANEYQMTGDYSGSFSSGCFMFNNLAWDFNTPIVDGYTDEATGYRETYNCNSWILCQNELNYDIGKRWSEFTGAKTEGEYILNTDYGIIHSKGDYLPTKKSDELTKKWDAMSKVIVKESWKAIYAKSDEEFDEIVSDMIAGAKECGYDDCLEWSVKEAEKCHEEELKVLSAYQK